MSAWLLGHLYELGRYAGICQGDGLQPHHVFLAEEHTERATLPWLAAKAWVKTLPDADLASLPTRSELLLLAANLGKYKTYGEYWSDTIRPLNTTCVWGLNFEDGKLSGYNPAACLHVLAVRRQPLEP